jgi:hypothetical protein
MLQAARERPDQSNNETTFVGERPMPKWLRGGNHHQSHHCRRNDRHRHQHTIVTVSCAFHCHPHRRYQHRRKPLQQEDVGKIATTTQPTSA